MGPNVSQVMTLFLKIGFPSFSIQIFRFIQKRFFPLSSPIFPCSTQDDTDPINNMNPILPWNIVVCTSSNHTKQQSLNLLQNIINPLRYASFDTIGAKISRLLTQSSILIEANHANIKFLINFTLILLWMCNGQSTEVCSKYAKIRVIKNRWNTLLENDHSFSWKIWKKYLLWIHIFDMICMLCSRVKKIFEIVGKQDRGRVIIWLWSYIDKTLSSNIVCLSCSW